MHDEDPTPGSEPQPSASPTPLGRDEHPAMPSWPHQPAMGSTPGGPGSYGPPGAPPEAGWGGQPDGPDRHRPSGARRRFGALALGAALVAGGGAGAVAGAVVSGGSSSGVATANVTTSPVALSTSTSSTQALVAKVEPALVDIHTTGTSTTESPVFGNGDNPFGGSTSTTEAAGTGMIISSSGLVLTNAHVLEGETSITVTLDGKTSSHKATLVGEDAAKDIALIQIQGVSGLPTVTLGDSSQVQTGDAVLAIGNALDLQQGGFTASDGIISGLNRSIQTDNEESLTGLLQTSAAISSGDSGGPLVDAAGQVIGMDTAAASSTSTNTASNIGFSIPSNEISTLITRLEKGSIGQTTIGSSEAASGSSSSSSGYGGYSDGGGFAEGGTGNGYGY